MRLFLLIVCTSVWAPLLAQNLERISIRVDAKRELGPLRPIYSYFGYDEPNYTYMKDGKKLYLQTSGLILSADRSEAGRAATESIARLLAKHGVRGFSV